MNASNKLDTSSNMQAGASDASFEKFIKNFDITLLFFVLKNMTDEDHAMSLPDLSRKLSEFFPMDIDRAQDNINKKRTDLKKQGVKDKSVRDIDSSLFPVTTLRSKIAELVKMYESTDPFVINARNLLSIMMGGSLEYTEATSAKNGRTTSAKNSQKRYYFNPILKASDIELICGTIQSNNYLSNEEKDYLLSRVRLLNPISNYNGKDFDEAKYKDIYDLNLLPDRPTPIKDNKLLPVTSHKILNNISKIYDAINGGYQIEIIYGTYDKNVVNGGLSFHAKKNATNVKKDNAKEDNKESATILNPYALFCNRGQYYMVATCYNFKNPVHYRVDRIKDIKIRTKKNKEGLLEYVNRNPIPKSLQAFYKKEGNHYEFDSHEYVRTYPHMYFYGEDRKINCVYECTLQTLQILVDTFGTDVKIKDSDIVHDDDKDTVFLKVLVKDVQYDNALQFSLREHESLTLTSPAELIDDIQTHLENSLEKYKNLPKA